MAGCLNSLTDWTLIIHWLLFSLSGRHHVYWSTILPDGYFLWGYSTKKWQASRQCELAEVDPVDPVAIEDELSLEISSVGKQIGVIMTDPSGCGLNPLRARLLQRAKVGGSENVASPKFLTNVCFELLRYPKPIVVSLEMLFHSKHPSVN